MPPLDREWSFVVRVTNHGPGRLSETTVTETPPATAQLLSARASQGECSVTTIASCNLGSLAPGTEAFVTLTIRGATEGDNVSTAIVSATADEGSKQEASR